MCPVNTCLFCIAPFPPCIPILLEITFVYLSSLCLYFICSSPLHGFYFRFTCVLRPASCCGFFSYLHAPPAYLNYLSCGFYSLSVLAFLKVLLCSKYRNARASYSYCVFLMFSYFSYLCCDSPPSTTRSAPLCGFLSSLWFLSLWFLLLTGCI